MHIQTISNQVFDLIQTPIHVYQQEVLSMRFNNDKSPERLTMMFSDIRASLVKHIEPEVILSIKDDMNIIFVAFSLRQYVIVIGPFLDREFDADQLYQLNRDLKFIGEEAVMTTNLFRKAHIFSPVQVQFIRTLYHALIGMTTNDVGFKALKYDAPTIREEEIMLGIKEEYEYVKMNYEVEDRFLSIVERGDVEEALRFNVDTIMKQLPKRSLTDMLRNAKTRLMILNTICNRAAIRGGITIYLGHQISTNYGILIENMKSTFESVGLERKILVSYATAVREFTLKNYSRTVTNVISHIRRNITSKITLQEIADGLFVTKEHLSRVFKKEMGMTIIGYVNQAKVFEAKKMLKEGGHSILDISHIFGFSNSAHFSRVFHEIVGMSPSAYRTSQHKRDYTVMKDQRRA
jgi:two-component system, response regulator YesN